MTPATDAERLARMEAWAEAAEGIIAAQGAHHEHLAQQIAELASGMDTLRRELPQLMAQGMREAVASPELWLAVRAGMRAEARGMAGDVVLSGAGKAWGWVKTAAVAAVAVYAVGGWPALKAAASAFVAGWGARS